MTQKGIKGLDKDSKTLYKILLNCAKNTIYHPSQHSPQPNNTTTLSRQNTPEVSSAPPRLCLTQQTLQRLSAIPKRITDVRQPETDLNTSLLGFTSHATIINAFSETATKVAHASTNVPTKVNSNEDQVPRSSPVYVSDSSPAKPFVQHVPTGPELELARHLVSNKTVLAPTLITKVDPQLWDLFSKTLQKVKNILHISPKTAPFTNDSLLKIATPQKWVTSTDMEILMYNVGAAHKAMLSAEQSIFLSPWLTSYIQKKWRQFNAAYDKEKFRWDKQLSNLVLLPGQTWVSNIHTIYAPMIWADKHWVGLAINLPLGLVEVLDSLPTLYDDSKVQHFLEPVLTMLPFVINKLTTNNPSQFTGDRPFTWIRRKDLFINTRGGDCGPLCVKYMEIHAHGDPEPYMRHLTDPLVDELRKQFALDIYKSIVLPIYQAPPPATT